MVGGFQRYIPQKLDWNIIGCKIIFASQMEECVELCEIQSWNGIEFDEDGLHRLSGCKARDRRTDLKVDATRDFGF